MLRPAVTLAVLLVLLQGCQRERYRRTATGEVDKEFSLLASPDATTSPASFTSEPSPEPTESAEPIDPAAFEEYDDFYASATATSDPEPSGSPAPDSAPPPRPAVPQFPELKASDVKTSIYTIHDALVVSTAVGSPPSLDVSIKVVAHRGTSGITYTFDIVSKVPVESMPSTLPAPLSHVQTYKTLLGRVIVSYSDATGVLHVESAASSLRGYHLAQLVNKIIVRDILGGQLPKKVLITLAFGNASVFTFFTDVGQLDDLAALKKVASLTGLIADDANATATRQGGVVKASVTNPSANPASSESVCKVGPPSFNKTEPFFATKEGTFAVYSHADMLSAEQVHDVKIGKVRVALKASSVVGAGLAIGPALVYGQWGIGKITNPQIGNLAGAAAGVGLSTVLVGKRLTMITAAGSIAGDQVAKFVEAESQDWRTGKATGVVCAAGVGVAFGPGGWLVSAGAYVLSEIAKESLPILDEYLRSQALDEFRNSTDYETLVLTNMLRQLAPGVASREQYQAWINQLKKGPRDAAGKLDYAVASRAIVTDERTTGIFYRLNKELFDLEVSPSVNQDLLTMLQDLLDKRRSIVYLAQQMVEVRQAASTLLGRLPSKDQVKAALAENVVIVDYFKNHPDRITAVNKLVTDFWSEFLQDPNPPSEQTLAFWRNRATTENLSIVALFEALAATENGRTVAINRLFMDLLGRMPNADEMQSLLGNPALTGPDPIFYYVRALAEHADNIKAMFKLALGRQPTELEVNEARGMGLGRLLMTLIYSDERALIDMFVTCKCKMPTWAELDAMLNFLPSSRNPLRDPAVCGEIGPLTETAKSIFLHTYLECKLGATPLAPPPKIVSAAKRQPYEADGCGQLSRGVDSTPCAPDTGLLPCRANGFAVLATRDGQLKERCIEAIDCDREIMEATRVRAYSCGYLDSFQTLRQCSLQLVTSAEMSTRFPGRIASYQRQQPRWVWTPYAQCLGSASCYSSNGFIVLCQTNNGVAPECAKQMQAPCTKTFR